VTDQGPVWTEISFFDLEMSCSLETH